MTKTTIAFLLSACLLPACATNPDRFEGERSSGTLEEVAMTPVSDLNLEQVDIPPLLAGMSDPYALTPADCAGVSAGIAELNALLGEDLNVPDDQAEARERRAFSAAGETVGSVLIPFRGVVRYVSGAAKHDRTAREAFQRGLVRRGYLKGVALERGCDVPTLD